jgi:hypothetical protein
MKKSVLLAVLAAMTFIAVTPSDAATKTSSSSSTSVGGKMKNGAKAVGRGIMWGPKKVGEGFKKMGSKMKGK